MKGTKEIQTQVYKKKKVFCKDCICNAILTVVNQDYALTTGQFAGLDFANHTFHRGLPKKVESLQYSINPPVTLPPGDPFPAPFVSNSSGPQCQKGF